MQTKWYRGYRLEIDTNTVFVYAPGSDDTDQDPFEVADIDSAKAQIDEIELDIRHGDKWGLALRWLAGLPLGTV